MGRWFARLGLDVKLSGVADLLGVVHGEVEHGREVVELAFHVGIKKCGVSFAAAPECVSLTAETMGGFEGVFDLRGAVGENVRIGRGGSALGVAWVPEEAGRAPEEFLAGFVLKLLEFINNAVEVIVGFREGCALGSDVAVVEAVVVDLRFLEELKEDGDAV